MGYLRHIALVLVSCALIGCVATNGDGEDATRAAQGMQNGVPYSDIRVGVLSTANFNLGVASVIEKPRCIITAAHVVRGGGAIEGARFNILNNNVSTEIAAGIRAEISPRHFFFPPTDPPVFQSEECDDLAVIYTRPAVINPGHIPRLSEIDGFGWGAIGSAEEITVAAYTPIPNPADRVLGAFDVLSWPSGGCTVGDYITFGGGSAELEVGDSGAPLIEGGKLVGVFSSYSQVLPNTYYGTALSNGNEDFVSHAIENICCSRIDETAYAEGECCPGLEIDGDIPDDIPNTPCRLFPPAVSCPSNPVPPASERTFRVVGTGFDAGKQVAYNDARASADWQLDQLIATQRDQCEMSNGNEYKESARVYFPPDIDSYGGACVYDELVGGYDCEVHAAVNGICCPCVDPEPGVETCNCCYDGSPIEIVADCYKDDALIESHSTIVNRFDITGNQSVFHWHAGHYILGAPQLWCTAQNWSGNLRSEQTSDFYWEWEDPHCGVGASTNRVPSSCAGTMEGSYGPTSATDYATYRLTIRYRPVSTEPTPGSADFDQSNRVDGSDFLIWQRGFGTTAGSHGEGDANGDGIVDGSDLNAWERDFGSD